LLASIQVSIGETIALMTRFRHHVKWLQTSSFCFLRDVCKSNKIFYNILLQQYSLQEITAD
jgi:hypothetical protein